jgi:mono/diheme cytochrome c family protein
MRHLAIAVALSATIFTAGFGLLPAQADDALKPGDAVHGKQVYLAVGCFECHGRSGQGGAFNYPTPALAKIDMPVEGFIALLRAAPNDMPAFSADVLSDQDAADIHAFLTSLPGRKPTKDFPLLYK